MSATTSARASCTAAIVSRAAPKGSSARGGTATLAPRRAGINSAAAAKLTRVNGRRPRETRFAAAAASRADLDMDDDLMDIADDDEDYPGFMGRAWADDDADDLGVSITPDQRRAAIRNAPDDSSTQSASSDASSDPSSEEAPKENMWIDAATEMRKRIDEDTKRLSSAWNRLWAVCVVIALAIVGADSMPPPGT